LFEAYLFEKERQNVSEAATHLKRMLTHFPNESWQEIENIIEELQVIINL
jgi:flagellin-specific chaperone FliS